MWGGISEERWEVVRAAWERGVTALGPTVRTDCWVTASAAGWTTNVRYQTKSLLGSSCPSSAPHALTHLVDLQALRVADVAHALGDLLRRGLAELQLQAVVAQRAQLGGVLVVADADDGDLGALDGLDQVLDAAAVAAWGSGPARRLGRGLQYALHSYVVPGAWVGMGQPGRIRADDQEASKAHGKDTKGLGRPVRLTHGSARAHLGYGRGYGALDPLHRALCTHPNRTAQCLPRHEWPHA